jgi:hypothetical protein
MDDPKDPEKKPAESDREPDKESDKESDKEVSDSSNIDKETKALLDLSDNDKGTSKPRRGIPDLLKKKNP